MASQNPSSPTLDDSPISLPTTNSPTIELILYLDISKTPQIPSSIPFKMLDFRAWNVFNVMLGPFDQYPSCNPSYSSNLVQDIAIL